MLGLNEDISSSEIQYLTKKSIMAKHPIWEGSNLSLSGTCPKTRILKDHANTVLLPLKALQLKVTYFFTGIGLLILNQ